MKFSLFLTFISSIKSQIDQAYLEFKLKNTQYQVKADGSEVTELDLRISSIVENELIKFSSDINFFSEEKKEKFEFPCLILDPIDGTKELIEKSGEFAVSLAILFSENISDPKNLAWIYNPESKEEIFSNQKFLNQKRDILLGYFSRSEFKQKVQSPISNQILETKVKGSIAYKLLLLAKSECDFVYTKKPKNVWDIAAGCIVCYQNNILMYENNKLVSKLDKDLYNNNILWCRQDNEELLRSNLT